jgi:hypothetical protein
MIVSLDPMAKECVLTWRNIVEVHHPPRFVCHYFLYGTNCSSIFATQPQIILYNYLFVVPDNNGDSICFGRPSKSQLGSRRGLGQQNIPKKKVWLPKETSGCGGPVGEVCLRLTKIQQEKERRKGTKT